MPVKASIKASINACCEHVMLVKAGCQSVVGWHADRQFTLCTGIGTVIQKRVLSTYTCVCMSSTSALAEAGQQERARHILVWDSGRVRALQSRSQQHEQQPKRSLTSARDICSRQMTHQYISKGALRTRSPACSCLHVLIHWGPPITPSFAILLCNG